MTTASFRLVVRAVSSTQDAMVSRLKTSTGSYTIAQLAFTPLASFRRKEPDFLLCPTLSPLAFALLLTRSNLVLELIRQGLRLVCMVQRPFRVRPYFTNQPAVSPPDAAPSNVSWTRLSRSISSAGALITPPLYI